MIHLKLNTVINFKENKTVKMPFFRNYASTCDGAAFSSSESVAVSNSLASQYGIGRSKHRTKQPYGESDNFKRFNPRTPKETVERQRLGFT